MIVDDTIARLNAKDMTNTVPLPQQSVCPDCSYCPHCGRGGYRTSPFWQPPFTYPYQPNTYPYWNTGGTWTIGTTTGTTTV